MELKGYLDGHGVPTDLGFSIIPVEELRKIAIDLNHEIREFSVELVDMQAKLQTLQGKDEKFAQMQRLSDILGRLHLDENWICAVAALNAQEAALRSKLEQLVKEPPRDARFHELFGLLKEEKDKASQRGLEILPELPRGRALADAYRDIRHKITHLGGQVTKDGLDEILTQTDFVLKKLEL